MKIAGTLHYNAGEDRIGITDRTGHWIFSGFHCGQMMEINIGLGWIADRIEYGCNWYLTASRLTGSQLEGLKVRITA